MPRDKDWLSSLIEVLGVYKGVNERAWRLFTYLTRADFQYRHARFGIVGHIFASVNLVDTKSVRELHWRLNTWTDEEVLSWKSSYVDSCNSIQVAGAIFASLGLTALLLPNMDATHWSARALLSCSMVLGVLAVMFASVLQQDMGLLNNATEIRLWMSRGKADLKESKYAKPYNLLPLESSIWALKRFSLPKTTLNWAVWTYVTGFGVYLLFAWIYNVEPDGGRNDFRNIFIAFVGAVGLLVAYQAVIAGFYVLDSSKRDREFEPDQSMDFAKPVSRKQLEEWLATLQRMEKIDVDDEEELVILEAIISKLKSKWEPEPTVPKRGIPKEP